MLRRPRATKILHRQASPQANLLAEPGRLGVRLVSPFCPSLQAAPDDLSHCPCRIRAVKLGAAAPGGAERVASGPDKAGMGQYCQMAQVRRAWRKGVREEPAFTSPKPGPAQIWRIRGRERANPPSERGTPGLAFDGWPEDHGEALPGSRGDAAGTEKGSSFAERITVNTGTVPGPPAAAGPHLGRIVRRDVYRSTSAPRWL